MTATKLGAAGKMAFGAGRVVSGVLTGTGHGLLGTWCRNHNVMRAAMKLGQHSVKGGLKMFREGLADWHAAKE